MRINKYIAQATGMSRRNADQLVADGQVSVNGQPATPGQAVTATDKVTANGRLVSLPESSTTIVLHKPVGFVVSREGQGSQTVYDLLPATLHHLKPVGRLDKDSSGALLMTDDGELANELTHPRYAKLKTYEVTLDKPLEALHQQMISDHSVQLEDGPSSFVISHLEGRGNSYEVTMREGRNRQIRRTFAALGYEVIGLHRTSFGNYNLENLAVGTYAVVSEGKK